MSLSDIIFTKPSNVVDFLSIFTIFENSIESLYIGRGKSSPDSRQKLLLQSILHTLLPYFSGRLSRLWDWAPSAYQQAPISRSGLTQARTVPQTIAQSVMYSARRSNISRDRLRKRGFMVERACMALSALKSAVQYISRHSYSVYALNSVGTHPGGFRRRGCSLSVRAFVVSHLGSFVDFLALFIA